jgi:Fic family protein
MEVLITAHQHLAVLNGMSTRIPSVPLFISMYVRKEALMSSQIEGTQATLEDVLDPHSESDTNRDVTEVINSIRATEYAITRLDELPLCIRLIKEAHGILMRGIRGQEKTPGEFRTSQNWIGPPGSTLTNARFIPPNPEDMVDALSDLEKYINDNSGLDVLIRAALIHYQFETIHPFLDGNGRIGRLLITLYLIHQGVLGAPVLYVSYFLKKNRVEYYDRLTEVRRNGNYEQWVKFFLESIAETAQDAITTIDQLIALHDHSVELIKGMGRASATANRLLSYVEAHPIIELGKTAEALRLSFSTVAKSVQRLCELGILKQTSTGRRNRRYSYTDYLDLLREGT